MCFKSRLDDSINTKDKRAICASSCLRVIYTAWITLCKYLKLHWEGGGVSVCGFKHSATQSETLAEKYQDIASTLLEIVH